MTWEDSPCGQCRGKCCSFREMGISLNLMGSMSLPDFVRWMNKEQLIRPSGVPVDMEWRIMHASDGSGRWSRGLVFHCNHRTPEGKCGIYDDRPSMCRVFECPVLKNEESLDEFLTRVPSEWVSIRTDREVTDYVNMHLEQAVEEMKT